MNRLSSSTLDPAEPVTHTMSNGGFPGEPPTNTVVAWKPSDTPALTDWRDQPIEVGTAVIWRQGTTYSGRWAIGRVAAIRRLGDYFGLPVDAWELDIEWDEQSGDLARNKSGKARGVKVYNVTVWPGGVES